MKAVRQFFGNDQFAKLAGIELLSVSPGHAVAKMKLWPHHWNGMETVHGGAIFTLADFAFAAACNSHGTVAVTVNANLTILKSAATGTLRAEAREVSKNSELGAYNVEVTNDKGELIAQLQGLAYRKDERICPESPG
ncbi:MAG: PaaI family thioesterase [Candidatus Omnitrophica bacterium]|nr:PaaI family thioesterase [Candidatus Omnitrophota bacterium]